MRFHRPILGSLTVLLLLGTATPAMALDFSVSAADFEFKAKSQQVAVGDKVVWTFTNGGHSTTSVAGQAESWDSDVKDEGTTFEKTFTKPGRYQYLCTPHESFMRGTIVVGEDAVSKTVSGFKSKPKGKRVTVSFKLNEAAAVTYKLKGASKRTVTRKRLDAGKHSLVVKRLKQGGYTGTLTLIDDFDKKTSQKKSFKIG